MKIELYKSAICPRCAYVAHVLKKLQDEFDDVEIVTYDIATNFKVFKDSKIRMIPTIKYKNNSESWILPKASEIREFILKHKESKERSALQTA
jgi:glutaredoxin-related protein